MALDRQTIEHLAQHLEQAELQCKAVVKISDAHPGMTLTDAYDVQEALCARKTAAAHKLVGYKCGLTSHAKMQQMGVNTPCFGFLCDYMSCSEGSAIEHSRLIHPKAEAEICIVTKTALRGPGCHVGAVLAAIDFVIAGVEIIDSRYEAFKFDLVSVIADNTSASRFVLGGCAHSGKDLDLRTLGVVMEKNGRIEQLAAGAAVLGHPAMAVAMLANHLAERGQEIAPGTLILTGGVTEAIAVKAGDAINVRFQHLGSVGMRFV